MQKQQAYDEEWLAVFGRGVYLLYNCFDGNVFLIR